MGAMEPTPAAYAELARRLDAERAARIQAEAERDYVRALLKQSPALQESEQWYRMLVEHSPVPIGVHTEGRVTYVNQATLRMMGAQRAEEMIGRDFLDFVHPRSRELARARAGRVLAGSGPTPIVEETFVRLDGTPIEVQVAAMPFLFEGKPSVQVVMQDVTQKKKAEAHRLEVVALKRSDELKDQFISILSHELRTPLNGILGFGSLLEDELVGPLSVEQHAYLQKMLKGAEQLLRLVNDLLDMSRIQAGTFSLDVRAIDLGEAVEAAVDSLQGLAQQNGVRLGVAPGPDRPIICADEQRIVQVLLNLVGNALKFTPAGGSVTVRVLREGEEVRCEVADTGPGIPPEDLPRLFQRFSQLDMTTTRRAKGTGLGLSISKAIVEAHGGTIGVSSEPGYGSTFWFALPAASYAGALAPE